MKISLRTLYFATAFIVGSSYMAVSRSYETFDVRKWGEIDRQRNIKRVLARKLLVDPGYADIDTSGGISPEELSELYRRADSEKVIIRFDSSAAGAILELNSLGVRGLKNAVQSYELELRQKQRLGDSLALGE